jgi:hypothetical protein
MTMLAAAGFAMWVPAYTEFRPQRMNFLHYEARHLGEANWLIESPMIPSNIAWSVSESVSRAGNFGKEQVAVLPWSSGRYLFAPAAPTTVPPPEVQLLADGRVAGERVVQVQLRSPRGGNQVALHIPETAGLKRIDILETSRSIEKFPIERGYQTFECFGLACDGLRLAMHLESDASFAVIIVDSTPGLPPGSEALIQARPTSAAPSDEGDVTLISDQVWFDRLR